MNELSKARVTVSMDRGLWASGKIRAHELNMSFSGYLGELIEIDLEVRVPKKNGQLDRIEGMLSVIMKKGLTDAEFDEIRRSRKAPIGNDDGTDAGPNESPPIPETVKAKKIEKVRGKVRTDDEILSDAQSKLERIRNDALVGFEGVSQWSANDGGNWLD